MTLLVLVFVTIALGLIAAVARDSRRRGYPPGYRRGRPLPPHPLRHLAPRAPRRPPPPRVYRSPERPATSMPEPRPAAEQAAARAAPAREARPAEPPRVPAVPRPRPVPLEERPAAVREPVQAPRPLRREPETTPAAARSAASRAAAGRAAGNVAAGASLAGARALAWSRTAAARARDGVVSAYGSPRTRRARDDAGQYARRAAAGIAGATRQGSIYVRRQYARDPRQTLIVGGVVVAVFVLVLVLLVSTFGGGGGDQTNVNTGGAGAVQPGIGAPATTGANAAAATPARSSTATAAAAPPLPGTPYSETAVLAALQARGLTAAPSTDAFACDSPGTTPKSYRVTANGAEQRVVLLVYPDAAAFGRDWVVGTGRPQYRNGACGAGAAVVYFNANVMIVFPQTTNAGVQTQISDAFLSLP